MNDTAITITKVRTDSAEPEPDQPVGCQLLLGEQRQRRGAVGALREDVRQVEDAQRVERAEDAARRGSPGLSSGSVMRLKRCQVLAPSTLAAS